jgi:hypothetical protein
VANESRHVRIGEALNAPGVTSAVQAFSAGQAGKISLPMADGGINRYGRGS